MKAVAVTNMKRMSDSLSHINRTLGLAKVASNEWRNFGITKRCKSLSKLSGQIGKWFDEINEAQVEDAGMPIGEAERSTRKLMRRLKYFVNAARKATKPIVTQVGLHTKNILNFEPVGLVVVIAPYNHPFQIPFRSIVPALLVGNCVVFKPSEFSPRTGKIIEKIFAELNLPRGVFSVIYGGSVVGEILVNADVDMISFAGSPAVGKRIYEISASRLRKVVLELGGKDALVICDDADIDLATNLAITGALRHSGQLCCSIQRIYLHTAIKEKFLLTVKDKIAKIKFGDLRNKNTLVGFLLKPGHANRVLSLIEDAKKRGAQLIYGGRRLFENLVEPTVLINVKSDMKIMTDETFGPVLAIQDFSSVKEITPLVNSTSCGLTCTICTKNVNLAKKLAHDICVGTVSINKLAGTIDSCPWLGVKQSGIGCTLSEFGVREFVRMKNIRVCYDQ